CATSRNRSRLAARKRPRKRALLNFSKRDHQLSALVPRRSKMPDSLRDVVALPLRKSTARIWARRLHSQKRPTRTLCRLGPRTKGFAVLRDPTARDRAAALSSSRRGDLEDGDAEPERRGNRQPSAIGRDGEAVGSAGNVPLEGVLLGPGRHVPEADAM